jgi:hypothetical protein
MNKGLAKAAMVASGAIAAIGFAAAPASAADLGISGASAYYYQGTSWNGYPNVHGTVVDTKADGRCARVQTRGYNLVLGWSGWSTDAEVCGYGAGKNFSHGYSLYSDHADVRVCVHDSNPTEYLSCSYPVRVW